MMKGWQLFAHSVRQVFGNFGAAVRISAVPMAFQISAIVLFNKLFSQGFGSRAGSTSDSALVLQVLFTALILGVPALWIAVAWHRFVLLGEVPRGLLPPLKLDRMWAYFLRGLGYVFIAWFFSTLLSFFFIAALSLFSIPFFSMVSVVAFSVLVTLPVAFITLRLSAGQPGAALGAEGDYTTGWTATEGANVDILVLGLVLMISQAALQAALRVAEFYISVNSPLASMIWVFAENWPVTIFGVSVMTTLYGHYVEKRPLV